MSPQVSAIMALIIVTVLFLWLARRADTNGGGDDRGPGRPRPEPRTPPGQRLRVIEPGPIDAGGILMAHMASLGDAQDTTQQRVVALQCGQLFDLDEDKAYQLMETSMGIVRGISDPMDLSMRMTDLILAKVEPRDLVDLDSALIEISETEGLPNKDQMALLQAYRDRSGITA